jgi:hypothetical protein
VRWRTLGQCAAQIKKYFFPCRVEILAARLTARVRAPMLRLTTGALFVRRAEIFRRAEKTLRT